MIITILIIKKVFRELGQFDLLYSQNGKINKSSILHQSVDLTTLMFASKM